MRSSGVALVAGLSIATTSTAYFYTPVDFDYGVNERVTANLTYGSSSNAPKIQTVMDTGSAGFWIWRVGSYVNWGSQFLGETGPCKAFVPEEFVYNASTSSSSILINRTSTFNYGSASKILYGSTYANDSITALGSDTPLTNIQFALEDSAIIRQAISGTNCGSIEYDKGILGLTPLAPFRETLFETGQIASKTMAMWFDRHLGAPGRLTGGLLFGAVDKSKYIEPLVKITNTVANGFYVQAPVIDFNGTTQTVAYNDTCIIDSGTHSDTIPVASGDELTAFYAASGGRLISNTGGVAWNGSCESIPDNLSIGFTFQGSTPGQSIKLEVPLKNYARGGAPFDPADVGKVCPLVLYNSGYSCVLGAPFFSATFFAHDDADNSWAFAKGAVSEEGSEIDAVAFNVGETFEMV